MIFINLFSFYSFFGLVFLQRIWKKGVNSVQAGSQTVKKGGVQFLLTRDVIPHCTSAVNIYVIWPREDNDNLVGKGHQPRHRAKTEQKGHS